MKMKKRKKSKRGRRKNRNMRDNKKIINNWFSLKMSRFKI